MKKILRQQNFVPIGALTVMAVLLAHMVSTEAAPKKIEESKEVTRDRRESVERVVPAPSNCGEMDFDRTTGGMIRRPNVDLVVKHLEIFTTDRGTWVRPTIRNRCTARISRDIHVSIGDVVITYAGLPPQTDVALGHAVGVPVAASYRVIVDYDDRIAEANERNNRCTRSTTGNCP